MVLLAQGWEVFRTRFLIQQRQRTALDQARRHYLQVVRHRQSRAVAWALREMDPHMLHLLQVFSCLKTRLSASRRRVILIRAAWHIHTRVAWRRFVGAVQHRLELRRISQHRAASHKTTRVLRCANTQQTSQLTNHILHIFALCLAFVCLQSRSTGIHAVKVAGGAK